MRLAPFAFVVTALLADVAVAREGDAIRVTLLGTGTPVPNPERFGAAIVAEAGGEILMFDCGRGAVIRLAEAGIPAQRVGALFLTHLHSDHVVGLPDLWLSGWVLGREEPLQLWGPEGTGGLMEHMAKAFAADLEFRQRPPESLPPAGARVSTHEVQEGLVYSSGRLRVTAFLVDHKQVQPAFGYRVDYQGRSVVISGDTKLSQNLIEFSKGTDVLLHAAWLPATRNPTPPDLRSIASAEDAGRVFALVRPRLAVVYHYLDDQGLEAAVRAHYQGELVIGRDLMTIDVGERTTWRDASPRNSRR